MSPRLGFLTLPGLDHFTHDILEGLAQDYDVTKYVINDIRVFRDAVSNSDVLWFEFLWPPFIELINTTNFGNRRVIVRLHAVEATERDFPKHTNWAQVDDLILVSEEMRHVVREHVPDIESKTKVHIVYNGVDMSRYTLAGAHTPQDIAWVGRIIPKKNPMMALQILHKLVDQDPAYHLHFAGGFGDAIVRRYLHHGVQAFGLDGHVTFHGQVDDMPQFLADKGHFLSTSISESFGYAIAEAMAAGVKSAVHSYPGVHEFWPEACVFNTVDEAAEMILSGRLPDLRQHIADNFGLERQISSLKELIETVPESGKGSGAKKTGLMRSVQFAYDGIPVHFVNLDPIDHIQRIILLTRNFYEEPMLKDMRARLAEDRSQDKGVVIDVGANVGNHTVFLSKICGAKVWAFEPFAEARGKLQDQIAANGLEDQVCLYDAAVGAAPGLCEIMPHESHNLGMTQVKVSEAPQSDHQARVVSLDSLDIAERVRMIKIDVEGMEMPVLEGAAKLLERDHPILYVEVADDARHKLAADFLAQFGYETRGMFNATPTALFTANAADSTQKSVA